MCVVLISGMVEVESRQFLVKTKNGDSASVNHFLARTKSKKYAMQRNIGDPVTSHHRIRKTRLEDPRIFPKKKVNDKRHSGKLPSKIVKGHRHGHDYVYEEVKDTSEDLKEADYDHSSHVTALCQVILSIGYSSLPCYIMHVFILFRQTQLRNLPVALGGIYKLYL